MLAMKFAYLIQAERGISDYLQSLLDRPNVDTFILTWREEKEDAIFFPNSTWTDGRNRLYQEVKNLKDVYDYFIFMDEDITFNCREDINPLIVFEKLLEKYQPVVGLPLYPKYHGLWHHKGPGEISTNYPFDACCNAIRRDALQTLLPYNNEHDRQSWWYSQLYLIHTARVLYPLQIVHFNDVKMHNTQHRPYPRAGEFASKGEYLKESVKQEYKHRLKDFPSIGERIDYKFDNQSKIRLSDFFDFNSRYWRSYNKLRDKINKD
jgi:hypothetical protein